MRLDYVEVGKNVFLSGFGGFGAAYLHYQFLAPKLPGTIAGINKTTLVDIIIGMVAGVATTMYTVLSERDLLKILFGYTIAGTFVALGLMTQFGIGPVTARYARVSRVVAPTTTRRTVVSPTSIAAAKSKY